MTSCTVTVRFLFLPPNNLSPSGCCTQTVLGRRLGPLTESSTICIMARLLLCALAVLALASGQPLDLGYCSTACRQAAPQEACQNFIRQCQTAEAVKNPTVQRLCETWAVTMNEGCGELISMAQGSHMDYLGSSTQLITTIRTFQSAGQRTPQPCCDLSYRLYSRSGHMLYHMCRNPGSQHVQCSIRMQPLAARLSEAFHALQSTRLR